MTLPRAASSSSYRDECVEAFPCHSNSQWQMLFCLRLCNVITWKCKAKKQYSARSGIVVMMMPQEMNKYRINANNFFLSRALLSHAKRLCPLEKLPLIVCLARRASPLPSTCKWFFIDFSLEKENEKRGDNLVACVHVPLRGAMKRIAFELLV